MINSLHFHHLGLACLNLETDARTLAALGYLADGQDFIDPIQGVQGRFMVGPGPRLELLTEIEGSRVLQPWLSKGCKIYHQAFEVDSLEDSAAALKVAGAREVTAPVAAIAFGGRQISFLMLPNVMLMELIERSTPYSPAVRTRGR